MNKEWRKEWNFVFKYAVFFQKMLILFHFYVIIKHTEVLKMLKKLAFLSCNTVNFRLK